MPQFREEDLRFSKADVYAVHCVDTKPAWLPEWQAIAASEDELVARTAHAGGASAKWKHYDRFFFADHHMNRKGIVKVGTHFPCGWFGKDSNEPWSAGNTLIDGFKDNGVSGIHFHFWLQEGRLRIRIHDPEGLEKTPELAYTMSLLGALEGRIIQPADLQPQCTSAPVYVAKEIYGMPPNDAIVFQANFTLGESLFIASDLNGGGEITLRPQKIYLGPDIIIK